MKKLLALVLVLGFAVTAAFGAVQEFGQAFKYTLDIPAGWTASQEDSTTIVAADDNTAFLSISIDSTEGKSIEAVSKELSEALKGTKPEADEDGDYSFTFDNENGVTSHVLVTGDEGMFCAFVMTGIEAKGDEIQAILGSLKIE